MIVGTKWKRGRLGGEHTVIRHEFYPGLYAATSKSASLVNGIVNLVTYISTYIVNLGSLCDNSHHDKMIKCQA